MNQSSPLRGQASGTKLYGKLGIQMQRAMFVLLLLSIPLSTQNINILVLVHQDKSISSVVGSYAYGLLTIFKLYIKIFVTIKYIDRFAQLVEIA